METDGRYLHYRESLGSNLTETFPVSYAANGTWAGDILPFKWDLQCSIGKAHALLTVSRWKENCREGECWKVNQSNKYLKCLSSKAHSFLSFLLLTNHQMNRCGLVQLHNMRQETFSLQSCKPYLRFNSFSLWVGRWEDTALLQLIQFIGPALTQ